MTPKADARDDKSSVAEHPQPAQPRRGLLASGTRKQSPETARRRPARRWIGFALTMLAVAAVLTSAGTGFAGQQRGRAAAARHALTEEQARAVLDNIYKTDYRSAFIEKRPELFLRHIPDDFSSTSVDGTRTDAEAIREAFPRIFDTMVRTIEHNVTIEDVDVSLAGTISAVVTLTTLIERERQGASGTYFVTSVGTFRDDWVSRNGQWFELHGNELRSVVTTAPKP